MNIVQALREARLKKLNARKAMYAHTIRRLRDIDRAYYRPRPIPTFSRELYIEELARLFRKTCRKLGLCPEATALEYSI